MPEGLLEAIQNHLPPPLFHLIREAAKLVCTRGQRLFVVGGAVRDLFLGRPNLDIDLVLEGDAIALANELARSRGGRVVAHSRFGTATVRWAGLAADIVTARSETYERPGALPTVRPGNIEADLFRRDFTVNAMAIDINDGRLIDPYHGQADLEHRLIRILHDRSFIDDATRIWRAIRYEQRLDFSIEPHTLALLQRDLPMLETISGDRLRHELELVLKEELPEKALGWAGELGVLARLHPAIEGNGWLSAKLKEARELTVPGVPREKVYLALLGYRLTEAQSDELISRLKLPRTSAQAIRETISLKAKLPALSRPTLEPGAIYALLSEYSLVAVTAVLVTSDSDTAKRHIRRYLEELRHVKVELTGTDLEALGVTPGPAMKDILARLREARLNGAAKSRNDEVRLVRGWVGE